MQRGCRDWCRVGVGCMVKAGCRGAGCSVHGGCSMGAGQAPEAGVLAGGGHTHDPSTLRCPEGSPPDRGVCGCGCVMVGGVQPMQPPWLGAGCSCVGAWRDCTQEVRAGGNRREARHDSRGAVSQKPSQLPPRFPVWLHRRQGHPAASPVPRMEGAGIRVWHGCGVPDATPPTPKQLPGSPNPRARGWMVAAAPCTMHCAPARAMHVASPGPGGSRHLGDRMGGGGRKRKYFCIIPPFLHELMAKRRWGPRHRGYGNGAAPAGCAG